MPFLIPSIAFKLCFGRVWEKTEDDSSFYTLFSNVSTVKLCLCKEIEYFCAKAETLVINVTSSIGNFQLHDFVLGAKMI